MCNIFYCLLLGKKRYNSVQFSMFLNFHYLLCSGGYNVPKRIDSYSSQFLLYDELELRGINIAS